MNVNVLIDSIVRQTTVLIAQLATTAGVRAPLAHVANQVFVELVGELRQQGLGNKVIADMFGLALRTYHAKVRRLSESETVVGRSLWEAVLEYVQGKGAVLRADVLRRFRHDDEATVRGVLRDLVDSGMLYRSGREDSTTYRAASPEDLADAARQSGWDGLVNLVWVAVSRFGPATGAELTKQVPISEDELEQALARLLADGRIEKASSKPESDEPQRSAPTRYQCNTCVLPFGESAGWEASVWDHFQAVVTAIGTKLQSGRHVPRLSDSVGGSTYTFDVWPGHPHRQEVLEFLQTLRRQGVALRKKVQAYNESVALPSRDPERVIAYVGQTVLGLWEEEALSSPVAAAGSDQAEAGAEAGSDPPAPQPGWRGDS